MSVLQRKIIMAYLKSRRQKSALQLRSFCMIRVVLYPYLNIDKYIPESYIKNNYQRLDIYKMIAVLENAEKKMG